MEKNIFESTVKAYITSSLVNAYFGSSAILSHNIGEQIRSATEETLGPCN